MTDNNTAHTPEPRCSVCRWIGQLDDTDRAFVDDKIRTGVNLTKLWKAARMAGLTCGPRQFRDCISFHDRT